jgi:hypothetical protein
MGSTVTIATLEMYNYNKVFTARIASTVLTELMWCRHVFLKLCLMKFWIKLNAKLNYIKYMNNKI